MQFGTKINQEKKSYSILRWYWNYLCFTKSKFLCPGNGQIFLIVPNSILKNKYRWSISRTNSVYEKLIVIEKRKRTIKRWDCNCNPHYYLPEKYGRARKIFTTVRWSMLFGVMDDSIWGCADIPNGSRISSRSFCENVFGKSLTEKQGLKWEMKYFLFKLIIKILRLFFKESISSQSLFLQ